MSEVHTVYLLMAQYNKAVIDFAEVCTFFGITTGTGKNWRTQGKFPVPMLPSGQVRLQDLAEWIDREAQRARAA